MVVPVFARPVPATPARAFVPGALPSPASSARRVAYLNYHKSSYVYLELTTAATAFYFITMATSPGLKTTPTTTTSTSRTSSTVIKSHGTIDHDNNGFIDIGIKGLHHIFGLCSSRTVRDALAVFASLPIRLRGGC
jgi:hypothetical protein